LLRLRFLSTVATEVSFLNVFVSSLELQYHTTQKRCNCYGANGRSTASAVYSHVMQYYVLQS
jgi:hypothetical protein